MIRLLASLFLLGLACAPSTAAPVDTMALVLGSNGSYAPQRVQLQTIDSLVAVRGSVATLRGGASIRVDSADPLLQTNNGNLSEEQLEKVFVKNAGLEPRGSFVQSNGVFWPGDFHTWNMVTAYYNLEQSFLYFQAMGVAGEKIANAKVYYFPEFILADTSTQPLKDNALFFSPIQAFAVLPFNQQQKVPLAMNSGVITHEYAHLVFNRLVYGGRGLPPAFLAWGNFGVTPQINTLKSFEEGLADYHAHGATCASAFGCNSRFLSASLSETETDARDFAQGARCVTASLQGALLNSSVGTFSGQGLEYRIGTAIAASLHLAAGGNSSTREIIQAAVLASYSDEDPLNPGIAQLISNSLSQPENFTMAAVANIILSHISDSTIRRGRRSHSVLG